MQLFVTFLFVALSAGALALPNEPTDGLMPAAQTPDTRNGLPYSDFDPYNHTLPYNGYMPDNHTTDDSHPHYHHHHHHNTSDNAITIAPRTAKGHKLDGYIASYSDAYCTITAGTIAYTPEGACVKFAPLDNTNIGINWGGSPVLAMQFVQTYTDEDCRIDGPRIMTPGSLNMNKVGTGTCHAYSDYLKQGGRWKSVEMSASRS